jgi:hypothetical protein
VSESRRMHRDKEVGGSIPNKDSAQAGKVIHDSRGNAVWDWAIDTDVTTPTGLVRALAPPGQLALESEADAVVGWGGDPYNRS